MGADAILDALAHHRRLFVATLLLCFAAVVAFTFLSPKTYEATATLSVAQQAEPGSERFDAAIAEQLARTYAVLAANANVASAVGDELDPPQSADEVLEQVSLAPVERTQLLNITAEGETPQAAQSLADRYARAVLRRTGGAGATGIDAVVTVAEPAALPREPSRPLPALYLALGAMLALALALVAVLLADRFGERLRTPAVGSTMFGERVAGRIPRLRRRDPRSIPAFQLLATNLALLTPERADVILITSPRAGDGRSTVARGLAEAVAGSGVDVVVVHADDAEAGRHRDGDGDGTLELIPGAVDGVEVLAAGSLPTTPSGIIDGRALDVLLEDLRQDHKLVILDGPPIVPSPSPTIMARHADVVLLVVDPHRTGVGRLRAALEQLRISRTHVGDRAQRDGGPALEIVLNRAAEPRGDAGEADERAQSMA